MADGVKGPLIGVVVSLLLLGGALAMAIIGYKGEVLRITDYVKTSANVTSRDQYSRKISYRFTVDGKDVVHTDYAWPVLANSPQPQTGETINVVYRASDPNNANYPDGFQPLVTNVGLAFALPIVGTILCVIFLVSTVGFLVMLNKERKRAASSKDD